MKRNPYRICSRFLLLIVLLRNFHRCCNISMMKLLSLALSTKNVISPSQALRRVKMEHTTRRKSAQSLSIQYIDAPTRNHTDFENFIYIISTGNLIFQQLLIIQFVKYELPCVPVWTNKGTAISVSLKGNYNCYRLTTRSFLTFPCRP